ncbi:MAG: S8 family serine peptidase [Gammaproteobacteria bacterium]|nr:S8 family serine peptidase [Gammaproteobacteria bacterium]
MALASRIAAGVAVGLGALAGCGTPPHKETQPPRPAKASLSIESAATVEEADNPKVRVQVALDRFTATPVTVALNVAGSATPGSDYAPLEDRVAIPANNSFAALEIDVYRDFVEEGDETIELALGAIVGNAVLDGNATATLTLLDGPAAQVDKTPQQTASPELALLPLAYTLTSDAVVLVTAAQNGRPDGQPVPLVAEWSTDPAFETDVRLIDRVEIGAPDDPIEFIFGGLNVFQVPLSDLAANEIYYVRAYLGEAPPPGGFGNAAPNAFLDGFATNAQGGVVARCVAPERAASGSGDPLQPEQWHLRNTGQPAFSDRGGLAGADLRMAEAMAAGLDGAGVTLAVVDTGLETCHPDLAANTVAGGSHNFAHPRLASFGAAPDEPFHFGLLGDHGTSVAGIAAAVADNGRGGRGVAPGVRLVGFNPMQAGDPESEAPGSAFETALLRSLGGSNAAPDSAGVDVFNMSFGTFAPGMNSQEEFVRLFSNATAELRSGRGALYVKAAGNDFEACAPRHPFNREIGCIAANADPDGNLPWLINVGGFNADDAKSSYASAGAGLWVVGPSGEDGAAAPAMITTDQAGAHGGYSQYVQNRLAGGLDGHPLNPDGDYVSGFGGTSSAAPAVAGAVALLLGVEPALSWRDVKHILASTARRIDADIPAVRAAFAGAPYIAQHAWLTNAAGHAFHNWYGFGAVDLDAAVAMVASHVPDSLGEFVESAWFASAAESPLAIPDADGVGATASLAVSDLPAGANIEAVVLELTADHANPFDLGVTLRSPSGTSSVVNPPFNTALEGTPGLQGWQLLSNAFYGEPPNGAWTLHVADLAPGDEGSLTGWRLRLYYGEHGDQ